MDGRRSCAKFRRTQARRLFTGSCESSAIYPRRKLQSELQPETECALKGDELREGKLARRAPVLQVRIELRGFTQRGAFLFEETRRDAVCPFRSTTSPSPWSASPLKANARMDEISREWIN